MNILGTLKAIALRFIDILVIVLTLAVGIAIIGINGVFITNIINSLTAGYYIDPSIGVQIVLVTLSMLWIPILLIVAVSKSGLRR